MTIVLAKNEKSLAPIVFVVSESGRCYVLTQSPSLWGTDLFERLWRQQR